MKFRVGNVLAISFGDLRVIPGDAEPRVRDLRLAERLEFEHPRQIRELIERYTTELENSAPLSRRTTMVERPQGGGRHAVEYWLTEDQALLICMRSNTSRAADVRAELIAIFRAWRRGELAPITALPTITGAIRDLFDGVKPVIERIDGNVVHLSSLVTKLETRLDDLIPRRLFPTDVLDQYRHTVHRSFNGKCPCGCSQNILDETGKLLPNCQADHWYGPQRVGPFDGWYIDADCNLLMRASDYREKKTSRYAVFHEERRKHFPTDRYKIKTVKPSRTIISPNQFKLL